MSKQQLLESLISSIPENKLDIIIEFTKFILYEGAAMVYLLLPTTSKNVKDSYAIPLLNADFSSGSLNHDSNIRPNKIFTLDEKLVLYKIGHINNSKLSECVIKVCNIIKK